MPARIFITAGILFMIFGVALGAFGAHALKNLLEAYQLQIWKTANEYQFYHALGLILLGLWGLQMEGLDRLAATGGVLLTLGILLFSGSLYLLALTGVGGLGLLTPIGGLSFIAGWICWLASVSRRLRGYR